MTTYLGKNCSFGLPRVPFVNCRQFMHLVISLLVLRAGCGIRLCRFLIVACLFPFQRTIVTCTIDWSLVGMKLFYAIHQHSEKRIDIHCTVTFGFKYINDNYSWLKIVFNLLH